MMLTPDRPCAHDVPEEAKLPDDLLQPSQKEDEADEPFLSEAARRMQLLGRLILPPARY